MLGTRRYDSLAMLSRSLALFAILYQFQLLGDELSDSRLFASTLLFGLFLALALGKSRIRPLPAIGLIALVPWLPKIILGVSSLLIRGTYVPLDAWILYYDANAFIFLFPWYWIGFTSYGAVKSRRLLRIDIILSLFLILMLFLNIRNEDFSVYDQPIALIALFAGIILLLLLALILSTTPGIGLTKKELAYGSLLAAALVSLASSFLVQPSEERAVNQGGGLIQPNLFRFDFSPFLRLESEIQLNDDLVLILRKDSADSHTLIRRYILSGYDTESGFFRDERIDEKEHPQRLPPGPASYPEPDIQAARKTKQDFFLVNFDPAAFIALNTPIGVVPLKTWDSASFNSAYSVESLTSEALPFELMDSRESTLAEEDFRWYTEYGKDARISAFAQEIAGDMEYTWDKVQAVYETLKYGDYRYSLKPGTAADGDQLGRFLFDTKKGYCSYFAFSMTLLLRSLGIPSRVAVGFFLDPDTNTFDYYPVRSDMAHAWVEVHFPEYGWIEYDPTTEQLAEGENFQFSQGVDPETFEKLMREILQNRDRLSPKEAPVFLSEQDRLPSLVRGTVVFLRTQGLWLLLASYLLLCLYMRAGAFGLAQWSGNPRKKVLLYFRHVRSRMTLAGLGKHRQESLGEYADRLDGIYNFGAADMYASYAAALFSPRFAENDILRVKDQYSAFSQRYRKYISLPRRILAWACPPLAIILPACKDSAIKTGSRTALMVLLAFCALVAGEHPQAQELDAQSETLYQAALNAQEAENWEQAISTLKQGIESFPKDYRFPRALGQLFASRKLYGLAWDAYGIAENLAPNDPELLYELSQVAGRLNKDQLSLGYLQKIIELQPENKDAISDLGWMYFKLHRLAEGETLLLKALGTLGPDRGFSMTLGTIYADMFRYREAKERYNEAILEAEASGAMHFTAVAHYNMSILESRFYQFEEAFKRTEASLAAADRTSGHLAKGELFLRRLDIPKTIDQYLQAYELDNSPLSKINLAQAYQIAGRLQDGKNLLEDVLHLQDYSWMVHYGTDPNSHKRDLHDILYKTYNGLYNIELRSTYFGIKDLAQSIYKYFIYRYIGMWHEHLYAMYCLKVADAYAAAHQDLDAALNYYNAFIKQGRRAAVYLRTAQDLETTVIPQAYPNYQAEMGIILGRTEPLEWAVQHLDPLWERDVLADAYVKLSHLYKKKNDDPQMNACIEHAYALNKGSLRQAGIRMPVDFTIGQTSKEDSRNIKNITKVLRTIGLDPVIKEKQEQTHRYRLDLLLSGENINLELRDTLKGTIMIKTSLILGTWSYGEYRRLVDQLETLLFVNQ